jgi:hypothetical protein
MLQIHTFRVKLLRFTRTDKGFSGGNWRRPKGDAPGGPTAVVSLGG